MHFKSSQGDPKNLFILRCISYRPVLALKPWPTQPQILNPTKKTNPRVYPLNWVESTYRAFFPTGLLFFEIEHNEHYYYHQISYSDRLSTQNKTEIGRPLNHRSSHEKITCTIGLRVTRFILPAVIRHVFIILICNSSGRKSLRWLNFYTHCLQIMHLQFDVNVFNPTCCFEKIRTIFDRR